jgi:SPP1 family predicted phage head-tail adaptor
MSPGLSALLDRMPAGRRTHWVTLQNPGPTTPDGDGGYLETWVDLVPPGVYAAIEPASKRGYEYLAAGTVLATATHVVTISYHDQITTKTRITFNGRALDVINRLNPDERNIELVLVCAEVVT